MGGLPIKVAKYNYKKHDRWLKEQFIHGIYEEEIMNEIIKELTTQRNMSERDSAQELMWAERVEAHRAQKKSLDEMKNVGDFDHIHSCKRTEKDNRQQYK